MVVVSVQVFPSTTGFTNKMCTVEFKVFFVKPNAKGNFFHKKLNKIIKSKMIKNKRYKKITMLRVLRFISNPSEFYILPNRYTDEH